MAILVQDNFNRANQNPLAGNWSTPTGANALQLSSNAVTYTDFNNDSSAYYNAITWPNDQYSQCNCTVSNEGGGQGFGPSCREASGALTRYRLVASTAASNNFELSKEVSGSFTLIWDRTSTFTSGNLVRLEAQGTTLRAYNNGVQIGASTTDSSIASGSAGLLYSSRAATASGDNFEGGDFTVAVPDLDGWIPQWSIPRSPLAVIAY
jgi:hypothetical protein